MIVFIIIYQILNAVALASHQPPNIVFLMGESVASSGYFFGEDAPMPIPNLQWMMKHGVSFPEMYAAAPCCNPSRATTITGRHAHKHGHYQLNPDTGLWVNGTWNNHEGLSYSENNTFFNFTKKYANYKYGTFGKIDWRAGEHSVSASVASWTNRVHFPFTTNISEYDNGYGWHDQDGPIMKDLNCNVAGPTCSWKTGDWETANETAQWIHKVVRKHPDRPFLAYWGSTIVHPPYDSTSYWLNTVNQSMVTAPKWISRDEMHPEDFQSSMKKKMLGPCCDDEYKIAIRSHYYAMIAEYDAMIGLIIDAVREAGVLDNTWIIATSDHGDMMMEHTQFYKGVPWDPSAKVPAIIYGGNKMKMKRNVIYKNVIASMLDWFPTIMDMAGIDLSENAENIKLDGYSLMEYVTATNGKVEQYDEPMIYDDFNMIHDGDRPNYVMSQFHGNEIHLSWFMLRHNEYKYVVYGSGKEVASRLFNIKKDPQEMEDLAADSDYAARIKNMDAMLREIVDYPAVSKDVESYNRDSFILWRDSFATNKEYNETIQNLRWDTSWAYDSEGAFKAINNWIQTSND